MDAHYDSQIRLQNHSTFHGPARQFGSGGMGAFAMRMGRVALPLMKKYVLPVAKEVGKNLVSAFVPEVTSLISGKKRPRKVLKDTLRKTAVKTITVAKSLPPSSGRADWGEAGGRSPATGATRARPSKRSGASSVVISRKKPAKRSRSDILSNVNFS